MYKNRVNPVFTQHRTFEVASDYQLIEAILSGSGQRQRLVCACGPAAKACWFPRDLHRELAKSDSTDESVLSLARTFGPLGLGEVQAMEASQSAEVYGEPLQDVKTELTRIRILVGVLDSARAWRKAYYRKLKRGEDPSTTRLVKRNVSNAAGDEAHLLLVEHLWMLFELPDTDTNLVEQSVALVEAAICGPENPGGKAKGQERLLLTLWPRRGAARNMLETSLSSIEAQRDRIDAAIGIVVRAVNDMLRKHSFVQIDGVAGHQATAYPIGLIGAAYLDFAAELMAGRQLFGICPCGSKFEKRRPNQLYCKPKCSIDVRNRRRATKSQPKA